MNRRGFLGGMIAAVAAPAIVRVDGLMRVRGIVMPVPTRTNLTISEITRHARVMLWKIDRQYDEEFAMLGAKIGTSLRIRLPISISSAMLAVSRTTCQ